MLNRRLLGVLRQYPNPMVGFLTTEILISAATPRRGSGYFAPGDWVRDDAGKDDYLEDVTNQELMVRRDLYYRKYEQETGEYPDDDALAPLSYLRDYWQKMLEEGVTYSDEDLRINTKYDKLVPWVAQQVNQALKIWRKGEQHPAGKIPPKKSYAHYFNYTPPPVSAEEFAQKSLDKFLKRLARKLSDIADWALDTRTNLMGLRFTQVMYRVGRWHAQFLCEKVKQIPGGIVYEWDDGWTMQRLETAEQRKAEGAAQGICVGQPTYGRPGVFVYSLRDSEGMSRVTIQINGQRPQNKGDQWHLTNVRQVKGAKNNLIKKPALCWKIIEFFQHLEIPVADWGYDFEACTELYRASLRSNPYHHRRRPSWHRNYWY